MIKGADDACGGLPRPQGAPQRVGEPSQGRVGAHIGEHRALADAPADPGEAAVVENGRGETHCAAAVRIRDEAQGDPAAVARANHDEAADTERLCHRAEHGAGLLRASADVGQGPGRNEPGAVAHAGVVEPDVRKPALDETLGQMGAHRRADQVVASRARERDHDSARVALGDGQDRRDVIVAGFDKE